MLIYTNEYVMNFILQNVLISFKVDHEKNII